MLKIANVTKSYSSGAEPAVKDLSLQVEGGQIFGFLGPNGAGKSTTIKMIVGILRQDSGTIEVNGLDNQADPVGIKRIIGYVPDEPNLYEKMTAVKYLNFIADVYGVSEELRKERIEKYSKLFEIDKNLGDELSSFSHGMKQKIAVISACIHDPQVIILDEPMVGLDPRSSFILKDLLAKLASENKIVFFSTHVMEVAEKICDRVAIINHGKLVAQGTIAELKARQGEEGASLEKLFLELTDSGDVLSENL
ncbi:MAG: ABC transporter ATP-binding protein [Sphaerochaetaceae bacterium]|jgi:ABC-2 type transport system ATP-binding protein|nr:ABC transporter ATP-binding protein [Sphaerochaetaceae bacterium]